MDKNQKKEKYICEVILCTTVISDAKKILKKKADSKCVYFLTYKSLAQDGQTIKEQSEPEQIARGILTFQEKPIKFEDIDKDEGTIEIYMEVNGERQPFEDSLEKTFIYNLKDAPLGEEFTTLNWLVSDTSEIAVRFRLFMKQSLIQKRLSLVQGGNQVAKETKPNTTSDVPLFKNPAFADRLKFFQKPKANNSVPEKVSFSTPKTLTTNEEIALLNPNKTNIEKTAQDEFILNPVEYGKLEEKVPKIASLMVDCFCEGFFVASFPTVDGKVIEGSQEYKSICGHSLCSMLPAMQSSLIFRYPLKDTKTLELNDLAATICFPSGIKICYGGEEGHEDEPPVTVRNYSSPITNQQGERYYMMTYHFYYKILNGEFTKQYDVHPLKHHMHKFAEGYIGLDIDQKTEKKIQDNLEICQEFNFRDFVYVPYCLCLISKFPYISQMEKCLQSIFSVISDFSGQYNINHIIQELVHGITVPHMGTSVKFYMPFYSFPIQIRCPKIDDFQIITNNLTSLLNLFTLQQIITIFRLMLFEKKILFVGKDYSILSEVTDSFISLIYPLQWVHTYIPIMSDQMIQYLQTFLPFINGIHETLLPFVQETLIENEDEVYMIYVESDEVKRKPKSRIDLNRNLVKKKINVDDKINETTPKLPYSIVKKLNSELKAVKDKLDNLFSQYSSSQRSDSYPNQQFEREREQLDIKFRNTFIDCFVDMFHDYNQYLMQVDDDFIFNTNNLIQNRPKDDKNFYKEFTESQLFEQFSQKLGKGEFIYFNMKIQSRVEKKNLTNEFKEKGVIKEKYVIQPEFLKFTGTPKSSKDLETELKKKFENNLTYRYESGINKESNRIIGRLANIEDEGYVIQQTGVYLFPDAKFKEEVKAPIKNPFMNKIQFFEQKIMDQKRSKVVLGEPDDKEKDLIKDDIKDVIVGIFKSEDVQSSDKDKKLVIQNMKYSFARDHLINFLCKNSNGVKNLQAGPFKSLCEIIFQTMLVFLKNIIDDDKIIEQAVNLFKCSFYYAISGRSKTIFDIIKTKFKSYTLFMKPKYWAKWLDTDIKEKNLSGDAIEKQISAVCGIMLELKLEKEFINTTIEGLINKKITDEKKAETLKNSIKSQISKVKYS